MQKSGNFRKTVSLLVAALFVSSFVISCGGGGGGEPPEVTFSDPNQAAASSTVGMAAIELSGVMGSASLIATDSIPAGYAPGKTGSSMNTASLATIDPRLKEVVDKMVAQLRKPAVKNSLSATNSYKTVTSAPLSSVTGSCSTVTDSSVVSSGTSTTSTVTVTINHCTTIDDLSSTYEDLNGSITATQTVDDSNQYTSAEFAANLTVTSYLDSDFKVRKEETELAGTFGSQSIGDIFSNATGTNSANGSFTVSSSPEHPDLPNMKLAFNFNHVSDVWSISTVGSDQTNTHTANGSYRLAMTSGLGTINQQTISLSIRLNNLENQIKKYGNGDEETSINGGVSVTWTPNLSQYGCVNGKYNFTTITPVYTVSGALCPTSGVLKVNNATIEFGVPSGGVTITLTGGAHAELPDCSYLYYGGMCGNISGTSSSPPTPSSPPLN